MFIVGTMAHPNTTEIMAREEDIPMMHEY